MQPLFFVRLNANNIFLGGAFTFTRHIWKKNNQISKKYFYLSLTFIYFQVY